ncbi:MAG: hypothetical protein WKF31_03790 [Thermoleophilaceae bacterium]
MRGTPYGIAVDPAGDRLWVTQTRFNTVAEFALNGARPRLVRTLPTVRQPNTIGVDPGAVARTSPDGPESFRSSSRRRTAGLPRARRRKEPVRMRSTG